MSEVKKGVLSSLLQTTIYSKYSKKDEHVITQCNRIAFILLCFFSTSLRCSNFTAKHDKSGHCSRNPAIVWYTNPTWFNFDGISLITCFNDFIVFKCDVYLSRSRAPEDPEAYMFNGVDINAFPLPRNPKTIWALIMDETPQSKPMLMHEKALNLFNLSHTFSRHSDVPMPLRWLQGLEQITSTKYFVNTSIKNSLLYDIAPVVFFHADCSTITERERYVRELNKYIHVDSYGDCLHNKDFPFESWRTKDLLYGDELMRLLARYKFIIGIENAVCIDYMTEKLWRAIEIGVVPIYYGSPLIRDWLPNKKSAILLEDFPTPKLLSQHLHYLLQNDTAYEEYLEHKTLGLIANQNIFNEINARTYHTQGEDDDFTCLVCKSIHNRTNSHVNVVTKKHYDCCFPPTSALTLSKNPDSIWIEIIERAELRVDGIYKEIKQSNSSLRESYTHWDVQGLNALQLNLIKVREDVKFFF